MALVLGTNCGFVSSSPSGSPGGSSATMNGWCITFRVTSSSNASKIKHIAWYQDSGANSATAYECGLYEHASTLPGDLIEKGTGNSLVANTAGWYGYDFNLTINPSTIYWLGFGCAGGSATTLVTDTSGERYNYESWSSGLPSTWSSGSGSFRLIACYALFETSSGISIPVLQSSFRRRRS